MKAEFDFDGERLRIYIKVEDRCEVALAKVMEKYNRATVGLHYDSPGYGYGSRDQDPKGVSIRLTEAPKCHQTGTWCTKGCDSNGCAMAAQEACQQFAAHDQQPTKESK